MGDLHTSSTVGYLDSKKKEQTASITKAMLPKANDKNMPQRYSLARRRFLRLDSWDIVPWRLGSMFKSNLLETSRTADPKLKTAIRERAAVFEWAMRFQSVWPITGSRNRKIRFTTPHNPVAQIHQVLLNSSICKVPKICQLLTL